MLVYIFDCFVLICLILKCVWVVGLSFIKGMEWVLVLDEDKIFKNFWTVVKYFLLFCFVCWCEIIFSCDDY